ncbi:MAG: hypothetical protein SFU56_15325 [Capsulimonadales bacterium]|nr:hypothetical protein [Capsulimonadales bacterium]
MELRPRTFPEAFLREVDTMASAADILVLGEVHGQQETWRIVLGLMPRLTALGYGALAIEIPCDQRTGLLDWAHGRTETPPPRFLKPAGEFRDGVGSVELLACVRQVRSAPQPWDILCFDKATDEPYETWTGRDATMARNLLAQRREHVPDRKILAVCGNMHSRIVPPTKHFLDLWPSFAFNLSRSEPSLRVATVNLIFRSGTFINGTEQPFLPPASPLTTDAEVRPDHEMGHTAEWHFPHASPVTYLL